MRVIAGMIGPIWLTALSFQRLSNNREARAALSAQVVPIPLERRGNTGEGDRDRAPRGASDKSDPTLILLTVVRFNPRYRTTLSVVTSEPVSSNTRVRHMIEGRKRGE